MMISTWLYIALAVTFILSLIFAIMHLASINRKKVFHAFYITCLVLSLASGFTGVMVSRTATRLTSKNLDVEYTAYKHDLAEKTKYTNNAYLVIHGCFLETERLFSFKTTRHVRYRYKE